MGAWLVSPIELPPPEQPTGSLPTVQLGPFAIPLEALQQPRSGVDPEERLRLEPGRFGPALANVAALLFAVGGYTMWLSAGGRFRGACSG